MSWATRVRRDDLVTFHVDGTDGSAVAGLQDCRAQSRVATPRPVWNPDVQADDELLRPVAGDSRHAGLRQRLQDPVGALHPPRRRGRAVSSGRSRKAPRACSSSRRRWRAGRSGAGSTCRRSRSETAMAMAIDARLRLPTSDRPARDLRAARHAAPLGHARRRSRSRASPTRPRTSSPIRSPASTRGSTPRSTGTRRIAYRQRLWSLGLGVAEAMDTAQRGMGLDWPTSLELIRRSLDAARDVPARWSPRGCGTDHLAPDAATTHRRRDPRLRRRRWRRSRALGGKLIVMASRALARVAPSAGRLRARLRPHPDAVEAAGDPALARRHVRPGARRLLGQRRRRSRRWTTALGVIAANPGKVDGIKISLLDKDKEIAMRRRLPEGVRMYTGDDFNYAELIAGDGVGAARTSGTATRCSASSTRSRRRRARRSAALAAGDTRALSRHPRADRAAVAPHLPGADALLQDRHRLPGLAERPPVALHDGRRPAERALARATSPRLFRLADAAGLLEQPELAVRAHAPPARAARHRGLSAAQCATSPTTTAGSRSTPRRCAAPARSTTSSTPARATASAPSRRGATRSPRIGLERTAGWSAKHGLALSGYCRGGMFPALGRRRPAAPRSTTTGAPSTKRRRSARACLVLVVGGLPGALAGAPRVEGPVRGARATCATASPRRSSTRKQRRHAARDRAAASDVRGRPRLRQHARAGARPVRCAATRERRACGARRRRRRLSRLVGSRSSRRRSRAPAASGCSPSTSATGWCRRATCSTTAA